MRRGGSKLLAALCGLVVLQGAFHQGLVFPTWRKNYAPITNGELRDLTSDQLLFVFAGFRELIAGILWVKADNFFDEGNFDAILPIVRLVTLLDPHNIDVFDTGMWHIAYNFTDEGSRSDRRYIPSAVALGVEGTKANPNTYELFYATGWLYHHKIEDDYADAQKWFEEAVQRTDITPARRNILQLAYQRNGRVDKAADYLFEVLDKAEARTKDLRDFQAKQNRDVIENNLDSLLVRMAQRGYWAKGRGDYEQGQYDTKPPFDVGFSAQVTVIEPQVIRVEGTWNVMPVGTRVRVILRDKDFKNAVPGGMKWYQGGQVNLDPPKDETFMQDLLFVKNQRFKRDIDMSRDPLMYPFVTDKYTVEFYYNPRQAPSYIQDKFGWSGEGMTDKNYLNTEIREGQRVVFTSMEFSKDELFRRGRWKTEVPVRRTKNFAGFGVKQLDDDVIKVPGLLSEQGG
ncbi:MAG: hypothetical protein JST30_07330 [Armatimonadetes bacterium]|nr:hypothetical protein [Armatimonadota bacterium]